MTNGNIANTIINDIFKYKFKEIFEDVNNAMTSPTNIMKYRIIKRELMFIKDFQYVSL